MNACATGACALLLGAAACGRREPLPDTEFLVISADSTFWVTSTAGAVHMRGVPMLVARVDGKFHELYVADDDRSYFDAVFVGHRLFSRDLERGDSVELHRDTVVAALADKYARNHPDEEPLDPDDPENDNASIHATGDIEILALHGPFLSFEHHTDVDSRSDQMADAHQHSYRRGVLDVRTGRIVSLSDLFGRPAGDSAVIRGRAEWQHARDSLLASPGIVVQRVRRALAAFGFDAQSFTLGADGLAPTVRFAVPAFGTNPDIEPIELSPWRMPVPEWWTAAAAELPLESADRATWSRRADTLTVTANKDSHVVSLRLKSGAAGEHAVGRLSSAVDRVIWLDSTVSRSARAALTRAFAEASEYDGGGQVAVRPGTGAAVTLAAANDHVHFQHHAHAVASATVPHGPRIAARVVGPDDAAGRERSRSRLRRGDPRHAGQDRGGLRDAARPHALRHRIG